MSLDVLSAAVRHWVSLDVVVRRWNLVGCRWISGCHGVAGCLWMPLDVVGCRWMPLDVADIVVYGCRCTSLMSLDVAHPPTVVA